ncbi:hypothetical protein ACQ9LF_05860 [Anaerohalosphaeraceae bacterium U12dextr]
MIKYHCPKCNQKLGVPDNYAGRRVRCSKCNEPSIVPRPVTEVVIPPAAAPAAQSQSIAAVDQADADPKIARKLAVQTLRASNKTNLLEYLANASSSTAGYPLPQPTDAEMDVLSKADSVSAQWQEEIDLRNAARKYYPALSAVFIQADIQRKMEAPDGGFRFALISSLGLLEVFWIFIGLSGAYTMSVFEF